MKNIVVVGGGISGLSTAFLIEKALEENKINATVTLLEAENRLGGKIRSEKTEGYIVEWGPNGFLDNKPWTLELCESLGITDKLLPSNDEARKRFIFSEGKLHRLPENAQSFFLSNFLSIKGRLRIIGELWAKKKPKGVDETIAAFATRRLGKEAYEKLLDPMVSGIFAGNPENMSLESCFPRVAELEREYGGLIKAMLKISMEKKKELKKSGRKTPKAGPGGPGGTLTSFENGLEDMVKALQMKIKGKVISGTEVKHISKNNNSFELKTTDDVIKADIAVFAVPAYDGAKIFKTLEPKISDVLMDIPYSPLAIAAFGMTKSNIDHSLDGFGFLIPSREKCRILGSLWTSSIFPNRAPKGMALMRTMIGGARHPEIVPFNELDLKFAAETELQDIIGINGEPEFVRIIPTEKAIPQYTPGHGRKIKKLEALLKAQGGIFFTGNAFKGIGLNDCVKSSLDTADKVIKALKQSL